MLIVVGRHSVRERERERERIVNKIPTKGFKAMLKVWREGIGGGERRGELRG